MTGLPVALRGVTVRFPESRDRTHALENVNLMVEAGEFVAIVGPSGCGKSTVLNLLAGLLQPTEGEVIVGRLPVRGAGPERIVVFQEGALFPWLTVANNVGFGLRRAGIGNGERERRVKEALAMVQLEGFHRSRIHELSGGMRQRVAVARALVMEPPVLLMDEPFANLDAQTREDLQSKVEELWRLHRPTVVFITHDVHEAAFLADRIIIMSHRPGTVRHIVHVQAARPRRHDDPAVDKAEDEARNVLQAEYLWQREQEMGARRG